MKEKTIEFGKFQGTRIKELGDNYLKWLVETSGSKQITDEIMDEYTKRLEDGEFRINYGKHKGWKLKDLPHDYLRWTTAQKECPQFIKDEYRRRLKNSNK